MLPGTRQLNSPSPHPEGKGALRRATVLPPNNPKTLPESTTNETSGLTHSYRVLSSSAKKIKKAQTVKAVLCAAFENAAGQCHFARGPTLKPAQSTGCVGSIVELRATLQSLTRSFLDCGQLHRVFVRFYVFASLRRENGCFEPTKQSR